MGRHLPAKEAAQQMRLSVRVALTPLCAQVAEWQTRRNQSPVFVRMCGFKSRPAHFMHK